MLIDLVIVTEPNPPGSRQLISPLAAVFEMAPAYVLQGAVRLQGLASSPTPETQVRVACAWAGTACSRNARIAPKIALDRLILFIGLLPGMLVRTEIPQKYGGLSAQAWRIV